MPIAFCMPRINPVSPFLSRNASPLAASASTATTTIAAAAAAAGNDTAAAAATTTTTDVREAESNAGGPGETLGDTRQYRPIYMFYTLHMQVFILIINK